MTYDPLKPALDILEPYAGEFAFGAAWTVVLRTGREQGVGAAVVKATEIARNYDEIRLRRKAREIRLSS